MGHRGNGSELQNPGLEEAARLYRQYTGEENLSAVVEAGARLVHHFASYYSYRACSPDLVQAGYEGLLKALRSYLPGKGASFATYAGHYIMGEIRHYLRKEAQYYRPGCIAELQDKAGKAIEQYFAENGEMPSTGYIAQKLNIKEEGVHQLMQAGLVSLEELDVGKICNQRYETFRIPIEERLALEQAIHKLSDMKRKVICLLFYHDYTQEQAAAVLGINQRKVSRLMHGGLGELREALAVHENSNFQ